MKITGVGVDSLDGAGAACLCISGYESMLETLPPCWVERKILLLRGAHDRSLISLTW